MKQGQTHRQSRGSNENNNGKTLRAKIKKIKYDNEKKSMINKAKARDVVINHIPKLTFFNVLLLLTQVHSLSIILLQISLFVETFCITDIYSPALFSFTRGKECFEHGMFRYRGKSVARVLRVSEPV